jgi:SAM-dependent methyltransferase
MTMASQRTLSGWLLCSPEEWSNRNDVLGSTLATLIRTHVRAGAGRGLDVGCQSGQLSSLLARSTSLEWSGVDPIISFARSAPNPAVQLVPGMAHQIPFPDGYFDCVVLANVFEHLFPELRQASLTEIGRVLRPGGVLVGQLPNPYFPIESHSRLPFMGWLPARLRKRYWRLAPVPWRDDLFPRDTPFYVVTIREVRRCAEAARLGTQLIQKFHYPAAVLPRHLRWTAWLFENTPLRSMPWAWQFVFTKR